MSGNRTSERPERDLATEREIMIKYLFAKAHAGDWHGVSDAANDLRVIEAQMEAKKP